MTKLSKDFNDFEFQCPCCGKNKVAGELVTKLQQLRDIINKPIHITSGYRCQAYNKKIGGYSKSPHLDGLAVDINVSCILPVALANIASEIADIRIGIYKQHIHIDLI
ncbi:unnamed protein product [marine sediment metagenome]|uniref:Peptidase M15A C-terminal domain-containing protein n=1 Tax=marine sediment metagenome TaxID=412755 RepID=X1FUC1_9ZZZZ